MTDWSTTIMRKFVKKIWNPRGKNENKSITTHGYIKTRDFKVVLDPCRYSRGLTYIYYQNTFKIWSGKNNESPSGFLAYDLQIRSLRSYLLLNVLTW